MTNEATKTKLSWKDGISIILFLVAIFGYFNLNGRIAEQTLQKDQVNRNTLMLETYNLPILSYKMDDMDGKLDKITDLLEVHMRE